MVKGMELFGEYFSAYRGQYVLIGGAACVLAMEDVGRTFRATQDLDIVLCAEALTDEFVAAFWAFIQDGGYQSRERGNGEKEFFRFRNPGVNDFPKEIELFSRKPTTMSIPEGCALTPIPTGDDLSSLSAILLNDEYYRWIVAGVEEINGVRITGVAHLVPLKMKAWLDLSERKTAGEGVDRRKIKKHLNDVFRLFTILSMTPLADVPSIVRDDVLAFIRGVESVQIDFKGLKLGRLSREQVIEGLCLVYGVELSAKG